MNESIALASASTLRRRVFSRFALDEDSITGLTQDIAELRVAAYEGRLVQLADAMGIEGEPSLYDSATLEELHKDARGTAAGVMHTHNRELRAFIASQPKDISQAQLAARVKEWEAQRQDFKGQQIARQEGYTAANQADRDVVSKNKLQIEQRVTPQTAEEPLCVDVISRGWMKPQQIDFELPLHISCTHHYEYRQPLDTAIAGKPRVWLGDWMPTSTKLADDDQDEEDDDPDVPSDDSNVTSSYGYFYPPVTITYRELAGGAVHSMRYATDHQHIGTVISRSDTAHTAVQWNGRVSEHNTVEGAITHLALAHGITHDAAMVEGV